MQLELEYGNEPKEETSREPSAPIHESANRDTGCPRCGSPVPIYIGGRRPVWCSQNCRRAAYEERRAARNGAIGLEVIQRIEHIERVKELEHDINECVERVKGSPTACAKVLRELSALVRSGEIRNPKWSRAQSAVFDLAYTRETRF